jgi:hypothetical protein
MEEKIEKQDELFNRLYDDILPFHLKFFENKLEQKDTGYLLNRHLLMPDVFLLTVLDLLPIEKKESILENYNRISILDKRVRSYPKMGEWIANRPDTQF